MRNNSITAYHGSHKIFKGFNLDKINTGNQLQKLGYGFYFTSTPDVAENYRKNACCGNDTSTVYVNRETAEEFFQNSRLYTAIELVYEEGYDTALEISEDSEHEQYYPELAKHLTEIDENDEFDLFEGGIYEVLIPSKDNLIDLDNFNYLDYFKIFKDFCDKNSFNELYSYLLSEFDPLSTNYDFDEFFEKFVTEYHDCEFKDSFEDAIPNADMNLAHRLMGKAYLEIHNDYTGQNLYSDLSYLLGSEKKASEYLTKFDKQGSFTEYGPKIKGSTDNEITYIIWDSSKILTKDIKFNVDELNLSNNNYQGDDSYDY